MLPLLTSLASLAVDLGPAAIRGVASLFGGSDTAEKVANAVEKADAVLGLSKDAKQMAVTRELQNLPSGALVELERLKIELEKQVTRRQELQLSDKQAEHHETQETIRAGDTAQDEYVRRTRPRQARQSFWSGTIYIFVFSIAEMLGKGDGPDIYTALILYGLAYSYHGLRSLDGFAPYSKSSGDKVTGAIANVIKGRK